MLSNLHTVTISGADDAVKVSDLLALSKEYPRTEWGLLYSPQRAGTSRYPSEKFILDMLHASRDNPSFMVAIHLCGQSAKDFSDPTRSFMGRFPFVCRIQVNAPGAFKNHQNPLGCEVIQQFSNFADGDSVYEFIHGEAHQYKLLGGLPAILLDASRGKGLQQKFWPIETARALVRHGISVGFAGGINPDNIRRTLVDLSGFEHPFWIDMESGVRTEDDRFDLSKVEAVLETVANAKAAERQKVVIGVALNDAKKGEEVRIALGIPTTDWLVPSSESAISEFQKIGGAIDNPLGDE